MAKPKDNNDDSILRNRSLIVTCRTTTPELFFLCFESCLYVCHPHHDHRRQHHDSSILYEFLKAKHPAKSPFCVAQHISVCLMM